MSYNKIDWDLIRTGCRCGAKLQYHAETVWCMSCGWATNWDDYKPETTTWVKVKKSKEEQTTPQSLINEKVVGQLEILISGMEIMQDNLSLLTTRVNALQQIVEDQKPNFEKLDSIVNYKGMLDR